MNKIGYYVVEQTLVMRDDNSGVVGAFQFVHTVGHNAQRNKVKPSGGFVENRQMWIEHCHLENFISFLFASRESFVY